MLVGAPVLVGLRYSRCGREDRGGLMDGDSSLSGDLFCVSMMKVIILTGQRCSRAKRDGVY